jgi:site-specific recombinase XerD
MDTASQTVGEPDGRRFSKQKWSAATANRYRALLSLTYRLAIRNGKAKENPARLVQHRLEDNSRIRFLSAEEETVLRKVVEAKWPERLAEFVLSLNTGLRLSEQYGLTWADVSVSRCVLTIPRSKNGSTRHVPLNQAALRALEDLQKRTGRHGFCVRRSARAAPMVRASSYGQHCRF